LAAFGAEERGYAQSAFSTSGDLSQRDNGDAPDGDVLTRRVNEPSSARGSLVTPISLRDQVLGVLEFQRPEADSSWSEEQIALIEAVSEQMSVILENSRLFADARLRAARERRIREISARMRENLDVERVLQTAVREIGQVLQLNDVTIQLGGAVGQMGEDRWST
jgi:GAF domain-containing protein